MTKAELAGNVVELVSAINGEQIPAQLRRLSLKLKTNKQVENEEFISVLKEVLESLYTDIATDMCDLCSMRSEVVELLDILTGNHAYICRCDCGNEEKIKTIDLITGEATQCSECAARSAVNGGRDN